MRRASRAPYRAQTHDERVHVYRLEADNGFVGWGDSTGVPSDVDSLIGQNPASIMLRDGIGFSPQALDLVGKVNDVPVHSSSASSAPALFRVLVGH